MICQTCYFHLSFADSPRFLFMPPSRYIFYGAEVMDSPLPSPSPTRNISGYLDSTSEGSDSDSVGEIDDNEAGGDQLDGIIQDLLGHERRTDNNLETTTTTTNNGQLVTHGGSGSDSTSDDGFDEGDADKTSEIYNSEVTKQALSLILGGLSSYTCASEESSLLSVGSDDPVTPSSGEPAFCLPSVAADTQLADRPFRGVTMDRPPTQPDYPQPGNQDCIEDTKKDEAEWFQSGDDCVPLGTKDDVSNDASAALKSDSLRS